MEENKGKKRDVLIEYLRENPRSSGYMADFLLKYYEAYEKKRRRSDRIWEAIGATGAPGQ